MIFIDIILIVFLFALFGISHTFLASNKIKIALAQKLGVKIAFYRLFYNVSSVLIFVAVYSLAPKPNVTIYDLQYPFDIITFALQVASLAGLYWATRLIDLKEFVGISQIERYLRDEYKTEDLDERQTLRIEGAFKFVRHPVYFFSILFLGLRPTMDLFYLIMFVSVIIYFFVGSIYEEKKLIEKFGDEYREYQKNVPRLFPIKFGTNR